jgi:hypothetical protein
MENYKFIYATINYFPMIDGFNIAWGLEGEGYGLLNVMVKNGKFYFETEYMSKEFVKALFNYAIDNSDLKF